ncbi:MAG: hypothetical protein JWP38_1931 [Herbaspirillum sp.]|nr:hypothetical protein [Herbaspirillum sp.]
MDQYQRRDGRFRTKYAVSNGGNGVNQGALQSIAATRDFVKGELVYNEMLLARVYTEQNLALLPTGVVFDAKTRQPLADVQLSLTGPASFDPARHLVGGVANVRATSDAKGRFNFTLTPQAPAGVYRFQTAMDGYQPPRGKDRLQLVETAAPAGRAQMLSVYRVFDTPEIPAPDSFPSGHSATRTQERDSGYLALSRVAGAKKVVNNHIGLHPLTPGAGLYLEKTADRKTVEIVDMFHYRVKVGHRRALAFDGFVINDHLPRGLRYVSGSARWMNGEHATPLPDPSMSSDDGGGATTLRFDFSERVLQPNLPFEISYRIAVGANAAEGARLVSHADVAAGSETADGSATVRVTGGVFSNDAFALGRVFLDCNGDQVQNHDEPGVPGVRIYLEDGSFAETDRNGNYSLYGLKPLTHVLKMDATTLPATARALVLSQRNAGRGDSRFLDLRNGELGRGDFALSCNPEIRAEVAYRREQLRDATDEIDGALKLRFDAEPAVEDRRSGIQGDRSSGVIGERAAPRVADQTVVAADKPSPAAGAAGGAPKAELDALLRGDAALRIVNLQNGQIMSGEFADLSVIGRNTEPFALYVNEQLISEQQIGQRSELASAAAAVWEYVAVPLRSGKNTIAVEQGIGAASRRHQVEVVVPGPAAEIKISAPPQLFADGKSVTALGIALYDKDGVPPSADSLVTLHIDRGVWMTQDANPDADGLQVLLKNGKASVLLKAPSDAGPATLAVEHGVLRQTARLSFQPALRPMIAAGIAEGRLSLNNGKIEAAGGGNNGFERELRTFARRSADGSREAAGRAALFLKGRVKGEYLLTASFDSDKDGRERLFRDIEPDKYYPVYGDDSVRGFDAQAASKLYLRIDKRRSYLVYGDFNTAETGDMRRLTQYSRAVNGVRHHIERDAGSGNLIANLFASRDNMRQQVLSFRAENTRFYPGKLPLAYVEGSERVELITADRAQSAIGQRVKPLSRHIDYTIDDLSGSLRVTEAVSAIDPATGGENFYRITFEIEEGARQSWLVGGDVTLSPTDNTRIGAMAVNDANPNQPRRLQGVFGRWQLGQGTVIDGEYAWTFLGENLARGAQSGVMDGSGMGWRVGATHNDRRWQSELAIVKTSPAFGNLSAPVSGGRFEGRVKGVYRIDDRARIKSEVLRTGDKLARSPARYATELDRTAAASAADGIGYNGMLLGVERDLGASVKAEIGARVVRGTIDRAGIVGQEAQEIDLLTLRTRIGSAVPGLPQANVYGEYEQDIRTSDKRALALGAEYALSGKGRLYGRHELISSLGSAYEIEENARSFRTLIGVEGDYMEGGRAFSEYRGARPLTERGPETAYGTRNTWRLNEKLSMRTSVERIRSLTRSGADSRSSQATSASTTFEYRHSSRLKGVTGLDLRYGDVDTSYLYTLGVGYRLDENWTMLGRTALYSVRGRGAAGEQNRRDSLRSRQRIGLAYRQAHGNRLNALGYYEHRSVRGGGERTVDAETAHIVSAHANFQPLPKWTLSGRFAAKYKTMNGLNGHHRLHGNLLSGRVLRDFGKRWDVGVGASVFADSMGQRNRFTAWKPVIGSGTMSGYRPATTRSALAIATSPAWPIPRRACISGFE